MSEFMLHYLNDKGLQMKETNGLNKKKDRLICLSSVSRQVLISHNDHIVNQNSSN